jgi:hypothetical protein
MRQAILGKPFLFLTRHHTTPFFRQDPSGPGNTQRNTRIHSPPSILTNTHDMKFNPDGVINEEYISGPMPMISKDHRPLLSRKFRIATHYLWNKREPCGTMGMISAAFFEKLGRHRTEFAHRTDAVAFRYESARRADRYGGPWIENGKKQKRSS